MTDLLRLADACEAGRVLEIAAIAAWRDMLRTGQANDLRDWFARDSEQDGWKTHSPAVDDRTKDRIRSAVKAAFDARALASNEQINGRVG